MSKATKQRLELAAQLRTVLGTKVKHVRTAGMIPAVLYGKGHQAVSLQIPEKAFEKIFRDAGESTLVYVTVGSESHPTIIHDVVRHPVSDAYLHADFYKVRLDEKVKAEVPIVFVGESPAVKNLGAILVKSLNEVEVEALPQNLPHQITVDLSALENIGDHVAVVGLNVKDARILGNPDEIVVIVQAPKSEEELAAELAAPTTDVSAVEEIKKEVPVEEAAEGEATEPAEKTE